MLESFKRLFSGSLSPVGSDLREASAWARQHGFGFKRAKDGEGFVVDGVLEGRPWRMEWGPPQRAYIEGHELRLRIELRMSSDVQMLVIARALMEQLERQTYEQFVEGNQTQIDTSTPEEMRWLVMFQKVNLASSKTLRSNFGVVSAMAPTAAAWIEGPFGAQLEAAATGLLREQPPFVLMTLRGRAYLRMQLAHPDAASLEAAFGLFKTGALQALRVAGGPSDGGGDWPSSGSTAWQSLHPDEPARGR